VAAAPSPQEAPPAAQPTDGEGWNEANIHWQSYEQGLALAAKQHMPVCLVFFTKWCGHCKKYSHVFEDARVVRAAKDFVMIKLDRDERRDVSSKYAPDGDYIPRTHFLAANGTLHAEVHAVRPTFKYFFDEADAASLLAGMGEARSKVD
jgi:protein-disulfide reductase (glutathione)